MGKKPRILWLYYNTDHVFLKNQNAFDIDTCDYGIYQKNNFCEYDIVLIDFYGTWDLSNSQYNYLVTEISQFINQKKHLFLLNFDLLNNSRNIKNVTSLLTVLECDTLISKKQPGNLTKALYRNNAKTNWTYSIIYQNVETLNNANTIIVSEDGNNFIIGFSYNTNQSTITLLPYEHSKDMLEYISELFYINEYLESGSNNVLPEWSELYQLPNEAQERKKIQKIEKEIDDLYKEKELYYNSIKSEERYKLLFTGTGESLRVLVGEVFENIGFEVDFHDELEEDLNIKYDNKRILVEVSGVSKGLKYDKLIRHHGRVISEKEKDESVIKGLLVINTFKDIPPDERADKTHFSEENILPYSKQHNLCIMTGLTLLNIFLKCKDGKMTAAELFQKICETDGVLEIGDNYLIKNVQ